VKKSGGCQNGRPWALGKSQRVKWGEFGIANLLRIFASIQFYTVGTTVPNSSPSAYTLYPSV